MDNIFKSCDSNLIMNNVHSENWNELESKTKYNTPDRNQINCGAFGQLDGMDGGCCACQCHTPYQFEMCSDEKWKNSLIKGGRFKPVTEEEAIKFITDYKERNFYKKLEGKIVNLGIYDSLNGVTEETSADRVGRRIRAIRTEKGMSQTELGEAVGLNANRIQQYENGARKPKFEMLKQFACVLGVETIALMDPVVSNCIGAMFAFFEMEELYELEVKKDGAKYSIQFGDGFTGTMNDYLEEWYNERETIKTRMENVSEEDKKAILSEYHNWKNNFRQIKG